MRLRPLKQWICDSCGEIIKKPNDGWFEWYKDTKKSVERGFRIVHHKKECMYPSSQLKRQNRIVKDLNLTDVVGSDGLGHLLQWIELSEKDVYKIADMIEFVSIMRRLYLPYWEEARLYWDKAYKDGFHDGCDFSENQLLSIIDKYGEGRESAST